MKSIKNETEIEGEHPIKAPSSLRLWSHPGFRQSHIRDGVALARYFAWLEEQLNQGVELSESQAADQLEKYRSYVITTRARIHPFGLT